MTIDYALLGRYVHELSAQASLEQRFQIFGNYLHLLGFDGGTYTFAPRIQWENLPALSLIFFHTEHYPIGFLAHYQRERLDQNDFTIRKVLSGDLSPLDWREHELNGWVSADEVSVIELARTEYGIKNALSIPTMLDERGAAGASIISYQDDAEFSALKQTHLELLVNMVQVLHNSNFSDPGYPYKFLLPIFQSFSDKETAILHYKKSGKPMKNIKDETGISYKVAANMLTSLTRRLGGINVDRLMYLFGLLNSLDKPNNKKDKYENK